MNFVFDSTGTYQTALLVMAGLMIAGTVAIPLILEASHRAGENLLIDTMVLYHVTTAKCSDISKTNK